VRHRQDRYQREDFAGVAQRQQKAASAAFDGQPRTALRLGSRGLQALGEPALKFAQCLLVGHLESVSRVRSGASGGGALASRRRAASGRRSPRGG